MGNLDRYVMRLGRLQALLIVGGLAVGAWAGFSYWIVPSIIESAYRGESFSFVNSFINARGEVGVDYYFRQWSGVSNGILLGIIAAWGLSLLTTSNSFFERFVGRARPSSLGAIRIWVCGLLLLVTLLDDLSSIAQLPMAYQVDMGFMKVLHQIPIGFDRFLASESGLWWFQVLTELLLFLGMIGWRTRIVLPLSAIAVFVFNGILREYSFFWHQNLVPLYVLAVLSLAPCADSFSIDRLRRLYQGQPVPDSERPTATYGWARYACWVPIAMVYTAAGFSKIAKQGLDWVSATNMKSVMFEQSLFPREGNMSIALSLTSAPDWFFVFLAVAAVVGEAAFITILFSRVARRIVPLMMILMHVGIIFFQNIVFLDLILLLFIFYDFRWVGVRLRGWLSGTRAVAVLYDGACPLCRGVVRVLRAADVLSRLRFEDFRQLDLTAYNQEHGVRLRLAELEEEMFVRTGSRTDVGFDGYRVIARSVPLFWPMVPWLYLPGLSALFRRVYRVVARNRFAFGRCDHECILGDGPEGGGVSALAERRVAVTYAVAIAVAIATLGTIWSYRIEYYPFTTVQMFTEDRGSVATYWKTLGHWESGRVGPIQFEDTLDFMSINSRYEPLFHICFGGEEDVAVCDQTLQAMGSAYNDKVAESDRLTHLEIQRWRWDFEASPDDHNYGALDEAFVTRISDYGDRSGDGAGSIR